MMYLEICIRCIDEGRTVYLAPMEDRKGRVVSWDAYGFIHEHSTRLEKIEFNCEKGHSFVDLRYVKCPTCNYEYLDSKCKEQNE